MIVLRYIPPLLLCASLTGCCSAWTLQSCVCVCLSEVVLIVSWLCGWCRHDNSTKPRTTADRRRSLQLYPSLLSSFTFLSITSSLPEKFPCGHIRALQNRSVNVAAHHPKPAASRSSQCLSTYFTEFAPWLDVALNKRAVAQHTRTFPDTVHVTGQRGERLGKHAAVTSHLSHGLSVFACNPFHSEA